MSKRYLKPDRFLAYWNDTFTDMHIDTKGLQWFIDTYNIGGIYIQQNLTTGPNRALTVEKMLSRCINDDPQALMLLFKRPLLTKQTNNYGKKNPVFLTLHCDNDANTMMSVIDRLMDFKIYLYANGLVVDIYDGKHKAFLCPQANTLLVVRRKTDYEIESTVDRGLIVNYIPKDDGHPIKWYIGCNMDNNHKETLIGGHRYIITNVNIPDIGMLKPLYDRLHVGKELHPIYDV